jgi:hypothetical protein
MAGDLAAVRNKIQMYLTQNFSDVNIDSDGDFSIRNGSAKIFVRPWTSDDVDWTAINLEIQLLSGVKETSTVFEHLALHADDYHFGHLSASRGEDGLNIFLTHSVLGDYLDEAELCQAVGAMGGIADNLDDELKSLFGGTRYYEE